MVASLLVAAALGGIPGLLSPHLPALGPDGAGLLGVQADTTDYSEGVSCQKLPTTAGFVATRSSSGALGPARPLGSDLLAGPLRLADGTFAAVLGTSAALSGECEPVRTLEWATLDAGGGVVSRAPLVSGIVLRAIQMRGGAVAWIELRGEVTYALQFALPGRAPVTVAQADGMEPQNPGITDFELVPGVDGSFLLAWAEPKRVRAMTVAASGAVSAPEEVGTADSVTSVRAGQALGGRAVIAWSTQDGGEERNRPLRVRAAIRPRSDAPFGRPRELDRGHRVDDPLGGISLAVSSDGRALLAWGDVAGTDVDRLRYPVYAAVAGRSGGFGRVERVFYTLGTALRPGDIETSAITPSGTAIIGVYVNARVKLLRRTPHARRFSRPTTFALRTRTLDLVPDPSGHLLALWTAYPHDNHGRVHLAPLLLRG